MITKKLLKNNIIKKNYSNIYFKHAFDPVEFIIH